MKRVLSGSLKHLAPPALLRLLSATGPSGVLELVTDAGSLRLEIFSGRVGVPTHAELQHAGKVLQCVDGAFRFEPSDLRAVDGESLALTGYAEAAQAVARGTDKLAGGNVEMDRLLAGDIVDLSRPADEPNIHVLPTAPLENPLDELLSDLEMTAPGELLLTQVGVVANDPRIWRGSLESGWRRRGWQLHLYNSPDDVEVTEVDALVLHHEVPMARAESDDSWVDLARSAAHSEPSVPVVWVGRATDQLWFHRLIEAGVSFVMPPPQGRTSDVVYRFMEALTLVVDRQVRSRQLLLEPQYPRAVCELVDTLLHGAEPDQAVGSLLQMAADQLLRGAVFLVEETAIRCRAGFGYALARGNAALPRGVGLLERVVRSGEAVVGIDPDAGSSRQLARSLGVDVLPSQTAVLPLGSGSTVGGLLVADREGQPLPDLRELALLGCCLGGVVITT